MNFSCQYDQGVYCEKLFTVKFQNDHIDKVPRSSLPRKYSSCFCIGIKDFEYVNIDTVPLSWAAQMHKVQGHTS